jgi:hypothetical protein
MEGCLDRRSLDPWVSKNSEGLFLSCPSRATECIRAALTCKILHKVPPCVCMNKGAGSLVEQEPERLLFCEDSYRDMRGERKPDIRAFTRSEEIVQARRRFSSVPSMPGLAGR